MTTRDDIKNLIAYMVMAFPNYDPIFTGEINTVDVMLDLLGDLPLDTLKAAVKSCCSRAGQFAPSMGDIREEATRLSLQAAGIPTAGEAWGAVIGSYERNSYGNIVGGGHSPILDNPLVKEAIHQIGGYTIDLYENQMANRAHFFKIYEALYKREFSERSQSPTVKAYIEVMSHNENRLLTEGE